MLNLCGKGLVVWGDRGKKIHFYKKKKQNLL